MHHKRGRPKNARGGCLMCKPHKCNGGQKYKYRHKGFGVIRRLYGTIQDLKDAEA